MDRPAPDTDRQTLEAVRDGSKSAVAELYRDHAAVLHRVVRRFAPNLATDEVTDLVHDTFLTMWQSADRFKPTGTVRGWLCGIAANKARARQRKRANRRRLLQSFGHEALPAHGKSKSQPQQRRTTDLRLDLNRALAQLPESSRMILTLFTVEELSTDEIAATMHMKPATVRSRLHRARKQLQETMLNNEAMAEEVQP